MNQKILWHVPVFSMIAGLLCYYSYGPILAVLGKLTDSGQILTWFPYIVYFVATLLVGGLVFFRNMTRKEIFFSASILVVLRVIMFAVEWVAIHQFDRILEWNTFWTLANWWSTGVIFLGIRVIPNAWLCTFIACFAPYLFVLFGRKE